MNSQTPLKYFSWQRVKIALLNIDRLERAYYDKDTLVLDFLYHWHSIRLNTDGRGELSNPWYPNSKKYSFVMPAEIQKLVKEVWELNKVPIPINRKSN